VNCYRIHQKSLNFIYPFKFYSNFTNQNVSWLHFSWATQYIHSIFITSAMEVLFSSALDSQFFVCLFFGRIAQKLLNRCHKIQWKGGTWATKEIVRFWW